MSKKAFIDAGHSGIGSGLDCGAVGNGIYECDINLAVSKRVEYHLKRHNVEVMMSRRDGSREIGLSDRPRMANQWGANVFVSIHCNSATFTAYGVETFCYQFQYRALADKVHNRIIENKSLYYANRGVKSADFCVLRESNMNACLVEMAFISNERDAQLLRNKQEEYAIAITKGILDYFGLTWKDEGQSSKPSTPQPSGELYRVRKLWSDASSQKSANKVLEYAITECKKYVGYSVFDSKGNVIFTNRQEQPKPTSPQVKPPVQKEKINVYYKTANVNSGYYNLVQNTQDYAGDLRNACARLIAFPNKGEVRFQVSPLNETRFYPEVQNYFSSNSIYDEAGVGSVGFDKFRIRFSLNGYKIRYRAYAGGKWWDWCESINNQYGDWAGKGDGTPILGVQMEIVAL